MLINTDSKMETKEVLAISLVILISFGAGFIINNSNITGNIIKSQEDSNSKNCTITEVIPEEVPSECEICVCNETIEINETINEASIEVIEKINLELDTFEVFLENENSSQAIFLSGLEPYDVKFDKGHEKLLMIKTYQDIELNPWELKEFLDNKGIELLIAYYPEDIEELTNLKRSIGVSIIAKMRKGSRN